MIPELAAAIDAEKAAERAYEAALNAEMDARDAAAAAFSAFKKAQDVTNQAFRDALGVPSRVAPRDAVDLVADLPRGGQR